MVTAHYIFDPMCGWCYGATTLMQALAAHPEVNLAMHPGGMMTRSALSDDFRQHILEADQRIAGLTRQPFGDAYIARVRSGETIMLDSYLTAQAILAAQLTGQSPFEMLKRIQAGHYVQGLAVAERDVLDGLATEMDIDADSWQQAMQEAKASLMPEIERTQMLMSQWGLGGFPSLVLEQNGQFKSVPVSHYYGRERDWDALWQSITANS
ncbi:protein-disulfide isomerase [Vibrio fluvialis]|uniref:DsbA family protein n=1 Tax=Vibrio fluvialis TaxID=676 RepID=UPI0011802993|nr:DsbA family protein [Vibrio fluvialis]TRN07545.1 protein-disulfide isomerase [Vibrio fluvialis]